MLVGSQSQPNQLQLPGGLLAILNPNDARQTVRQQFAIAGLELPFTHSRQDRTRLIGQRRPIKVKGHLVLNGSDRRYQRGE